MGRGFGYDITKCTAIVYTCPLVQEQPPAENGEYGSITQEMLTVRQQEVL